MTNRIFCPCCTQTTKMIQGQRVTLGVDLDITEHSYSGCGVDLAECPDCKRKFSISYKVDEIRDIT